MLPDKLLQDVLAEAQVVCVGQPLLILGDLNADPGVIPCLAKGISSGKFVDLALGYSLGAGKMPDATYKFTPHFSAVADFCIRPLHCWSRLSCLHSAGLARLLDRYAG